MSIEVRLDKILAPSPGQTTRAPAAVNGSGKALPLAEPTAKQDGNVVPARNQPPESRARVNEQKQKDLAAAIAQAAQYLRESGRPVSFQVQSSAERTVIQEIDPDTGEIIAELTSDEFLSLARGLGLAGSLIDEHA